MCCCQDIDWHLHSEDLPKTSLHCRGHLPARNSDGFSWYYFFRGCWRKKKLTFYSKKYSFIDILLEITGELTILWMLAKWKVKNTETYSLFKTQPMLLSARSREDQWDADLHAVQNPEYALVRNKQKEPVRCWLTSCSKPRASSCQQQAGRASQMLTYNLFKIQRMLPSETSSKGQPDADLQAVQNPKHHLVSSKKEGPARCWLTGCSKPRASSCQQQAGRASLLLTYILFKTQSII